MSQLLKSQPWFWGDEDDDEINRALEHCLDGTFVVRNNSNKIDYTLHVVYKGVVRKIRILCQDGVVGLSKDNMSFGSVFSLVENFSNVSIAVHNKAVNVRLTNPLSKHYTLDEGDSYSENDQTWTIYVDLYMRSNILNKLGDECTRNLLQAEEAAQIASYRSTAQHKVIEVWQEQIKNRTMALNHFGRELNEFVNKNFDLQQVRLEEANRELEKISQTVTDKQAKVRQIVLKREDIEIKKRKLFRQMDWFERLLQIEGIDNATVVKCIQPFKQDLGNQLLIQGIKEMWFVGILDKNSAQLLLENKPNGTYLVRVTTRGSFVMGVVNESNVRHIIIHEKKGKEGYWLQPYKKFASVEKLVDYFKEHCLGEEDANYSTKLLYPVYY